MDPGEVKRRLRLPNDTAERVSRYFTIEQGTRGRLKVRKVKAVQPSLFFHKFMLDPDEQVKGEFLRAFAEWCANFNDLHTLRDACLKRLEGLTEQLGSTGHPGWRVYKRDAEVKWRLIVGLGGAHVYETSMTLHRLYGFPYIPGSSVKGLLHTYALLDLWYEKGVGSPMGDFSYGNTAPGLASVAEALMAGDLGAFQKEGLGEDVLPELKRIHAVFGSRRERGQVVFLDALPVGNRVMLEVDIMNPHYSKYYTGQLPPADWQEPTPIPFLTVGKGTTFRFMWMCRDGSLAQAVSHWLGAALEETGVGAKTRSGYGAMKVRGS
jgi:CRISPR-associated protein Cmr6